MQCEQAHPAGRVNRVLMRMIAGFGDSIGDIVDRDDSVEENHHHENQEAEREVVQKWITDHGRLPVNGALIAQAKAEWL